MLTGFKLNRPVLKYDHTKLRGCLIERDINLYKTDIKRKVEPITPYFLKKKYTYKSFIAEHFYKTLIGIAPAITFVLSSYVSLLANLLVMAGYAILILLSKAKRDSLLKKEFMERYYRQESNYRTSLL